MKVDDYADMQSRFEYVVLEYTRMIMGETAEGARRRRRQTSDSLDEDLTCEVVEV